MILPACDSNTSGKIKESYNQTLFLLYTGVYMVGYFKVILVLLLTAIPTCLGTATDIT